MRVLICGSRTWTDKKAVGVVLSGLVVEGSGCLTVIHGGARGADTLAAESAAWVICDDFDLPEIVAFPADWTTHGKAAGPIRNQQMLDEGKPDVVWAFTDDLAASKGTADMVRRARKAGLPVYVVSRAS